jgi:hypothetical protein
VAFSTPAPASQLPAKIKIINLQIWCCSFIKPMVICWQIWDKV